MRKRRQGEADHDLKKGQRGDQEVLEMRKGKILLKYTKLLQTSKVNHNPKYEVEKLEIV